jgi:hypothetical protein
MRGHTDMVLSGVSLRQEGNMARLCTSALGDARNLLDYYAEDDY